MIQFRKGCFETNSSSSHSICLNEKLPERMSQDDIVTEFSHLIDTNGTLHMERVDSEFGWDWGVLTSCVDKLAYALQEYRYNDNMIYNIENMIRDVMPGIKVVITNEDGYLDHQSVGVLSGYLANHTVTLEDVIFSDRYAIVTANDNEDYSDEYASLKRSDGYVVVWG